MRRPLLILTLSLAVLPASAAADPPKAGKRYDGSVGADQRGFMAVNRDGTQFADYEFTARMRCSNGRRRLVGFGREGEDPTRIAPDGSFSFAAPFKKLTTPYRGERGGTASASFSGRFGDGGEAVTGTFRMRYQFRGLTCDTGDLPLAFSRDGTRSAPFRNARIATGAYTARRRGFRATLRAFLPGRSVSGRIRYRPTCTVGTTAGSFTDRLFPHPLRGSRVRIRRALRGRLRDGSRFRSTTSLTGSFRRRGGYRFRGVWRSTTTYRRGGRVTGSCVALHRFSARFRGGPRNG